VGIAGRLPWWYSPVYTLVVYSPVYTLVVYMPPYTTPGTPTMLPSHHTGTRWTTSSDGLSALDHGVA